VDGKPVYCALAIAGLTLRSALASGAARYTNQHGPNG
jgi:hypothetical protein